MNFRFTIDRLTNNASYKILGDGSEYEHIWGFEGKPTRQECVDAWNNGLEIDYINEQADKNRERGYRAIDGEQIRALWDFVEKLIEDGATPSEEVTDILDKRKKIKDKYPKVKKA